MAYRYSKEQMHVIERAYIMGFNCALDEVSARLEAQNVVKYRKKIEDCPEFRIKRVEDLINRHFEISNDGICEVDKMRLNNMKFEIKGEVKGA